MGGMSPVLYPSSRTDGSPRNDHQFDADGGIRAQTATTRETNPKDPIEGFDWAELEQRYLARIHDCEQAEKDIYDDFQQWYQMFEIWTTTSSVLKTRISHVEGAEGQLEEKRQHYINVVKAFESALALLGGLDLSRNR
ncbi:hypothetical protein MMC20_004264 [Loxospora ochrophaea]|nr:hypothetical protein [Loxospora ochrophaea]